MVKFQEGHILVAGVITIFEPPECLLANVESFINQIDLLIVINNGRLDLSFLKQQFLQDKILIKNFPENIGVASGLNVAADLAIENKMNYLLMMDQDSFAPPDLIYSFLNSLVSIDKETFGIISPVYKYENYKSSGEEEKMTEVNFAITSGSFLNLSAYLKAGPFVDKFFIDYVDFEYCLRLKSIGFKVYKVNDTYIRHELGKIIRRKIFFRDVSVTHHSPERYYYRTRNRFYLYRTYFTSYPVIIMKDLVVFWNEILKIILYEDNRLNKIKMIFRGFHHFLQNKYGKIDF